MPTVIRRDIRATPYRTAHETWTFICNLLAKGGTTAATELMAVSGTAEQLICSESPRSAAIVVYGSGPRLRIYCLYDEDALGDDAREDALSFNPTANEWRMSLPAKDDDVTWAKAELEARSKRISARSKDDTIEEVDDEREAATSVPAVDVKAFLQP